MARSKLFRFRFTHQDELLDVRAKFDDGDPNATPPVDPFITDLEAWPAGVSVFKGQAKTDLQTELDRALKAGELEPVDRNPRG